MRAWWATVGIATLLALGGCTGQPLPDATGEQIYAQLCARCHGDGLEGGVGPPLGPGSTSADEDDAFLEFTILNGRGRMPSFSTTLDQDQLERLIRFIREVQAGE